MSIFRQFKNVFFYIEYPSKKFDFFFIYIYKKKKYLFNFDLFKIFLQYFNSNQPQGSRLNLLDEDIDISEAPVQDFINFC